MIERLEKLSIYSLKNRVNTEVRSRDELNAKLDSLLDDIMRNKTKEKQRSF